MVKLTKEEKTDLDLRERMRQATIVLKWGFQMNFLRTRRWHNKLKVATIDRPKVSAHDIGSRFDLDHYQLQICVQRAKNFIFHVNYTERERLQRERLFPKKKKLPALWFYMDDTPIEPLLKGLKAAA